MCVLRYALVDFGLAQGTPDTQIELLKVVNSQKAQKDSHRKQTLLPLPPHSSTKAPEKRPQCPQSRTKHSKVSVSLWCTTFTILFPGEDTRAFLHNHSIGVETKCSETSKILCALFTAALGSAQLPFIFIFTFFLHVYLLKSHH